MRRNWTHRCSSSHCPQNCSNSSNPHRSSRHCYSYRRQGRPQGAGTPLDTAPYIPIFIFLKTTTPPNGGNSGGVPPPFLPLLLTQRWAELEAQNDSDRILGVFDDKVDNGEVLSGSTPLGYKIVNKHLVPDDDAPTAVAIFQYYRKTGNLSMTLRYMESEFGLVRSAASLKNMLTNTKYIGEFRDNKNYCPAIIDRDLFFDVQRLLKINIKSGKKHDYIFSGLVVCDDCDHIMSGCQQRAGGRVRADGTRIVYKYSVYRCRQGVNLHRCPNRKLVFETTLEKMLLERIRPELENYIAEYEVANLPALRTDAKRRSIEGKMQKLKALYLNDLITMDEFKLDREKLLMQLEKINAEDSRPVKDLSYLKNFLKMDFESVYDSLSIPERRELWRSIVKEIRVDHDKNIHIIFL